MRWSALAALPLLLAAGSSAAGPAPEQPAPAPPPPAEQSPQEDTSDRGPSTASVPGIKTRLESGLAELASLAERAKGEGDAVLAACILDKLERGRDVMEVATGELMVIQDGSTTQRQKAFAVEKLQAAADRMDRLVEAAQACTGDQAPEDEDDLTRNEVDEPQTIPVEDPTLGGGEPPVLPPLDSTDPVSIASPSV